jgi:hypothetical protein
MSDRNNIGIGLDPATYNRTKKQAHKKGLSMRQYLHDLVLEDGKRKEAAQ